MTVGPTPLLWSSGQVFSDDRTLFQVLKTHAEEMWTKVSVIPGVKTDQSRVRLTQICDTTKGFHETCRYEVPVGGGVKRPTPPERDPVG